MDILRESVEGAESGMAKCVFSMIEWIFEKRTHFCDWKGLWRSIYRQKKDFYPKEAFYG